MRLLLALLLTLTTNCASHGYTAIVFKNGEVIAKQTKKPKIRNGVIEIEGETLMLIPLGSVWFVYWMAE